MAAVDRTLLNVVRSVSMRVGNFRAYVETLSDPDIPTKNMIECVNCVIRKMCRAKPSPMLNANYNVRIYDNVTGDGVSDSITTIGSTGLVTGSGSSFTEIYNEGAYTAATDRSNIVLYITEPDVVSEAFPLRVYQVYSDTSLSIAESWPSEWGDISGVTYSYSLCRDRVTLPVDFASLLSVAVQSHSSTTANSFLTMKQWSEIEYIRNTIAAGGVLASAYQIGMPVYCAVIEKDQLFRLQLYPMPDRDYGLYINYSRAHKYIEDDGDYVMIPDSAMDVLVSGVDALWSSFSKQGYENAYEAWHREVLQPWAGMTLRRTDATPPKIRQREEVSPLSRMRI